MFNIGEFARLGEVSVRALRHYDEVGLLVPTSVDPNNGYRRYSITQLGDLNRIVALRQLGFPLPKIGQLLAGITETELKEMLTTRRTELEGALERDRANLSQVEARIRALDSEHKLADDVVAKTVPTRRYVVLEGVVPGLGPTPENEAVTVPLRRSLYDAIRASALPVEPIPALTCFEEREDDDKLAVFVGCPAPDGLGEVEPPLQLVELPGATVATCVRTGHLNVVWPRIAKDVYRWIYAQGYTHAGIGRSFCLSWVGQESDQNTFELHAPFYGSNEPAPIVAPQRLGTRASV